MIKFFSNLFGRGTQVRTEQVDKANTANRIGSLFEDLAKATPMKWDPSAPYEAGQVAYFNDLRCEAVLATAAGESPQTHPLKWSIKLATNASQITSSNPLPVTAAAVWQALESFEAGPGNNVPNASTTERGLARQATEGETKEGVVDDAYVTPKGLKDEINGSSGFKTNLTQVLTEGRTGKGPITLQRDSVQGQPGIFFEINDETPLGGLEITPQDDVVVSRKGAPRVAFDDDQNKYFASEHYFDNYTNSSFGTYRDMPEVDSADYLTVSVPDPNLPGLDVQAKMKISNLSAPAVGTSLDTDLLGNHLYLKEAVAYSGTLTNLGTLVEISPGKWQFQTVSAQQIAGFVGPWLPKQGGGGQIDTRQTIFLGCDDEQQQPQNEDSIVFDHVALNTPLVHNLQTYQNNITLDGAYVYVSDPDLVDQGLLGEAAYSWKRDFNLDPYIKFPDVDHVKIAAEAPAAYANTKILVNIKRFVRI